MTNPSRGNAHKPAAPERPRRMKVLALMALAAAIGSGALLATMKSSLVVFSPHESSRARFSATPIMPTTVSWGFNNRSAAIRLPSKSLAGQHLEHRIAGADANIEAVIGVILQGVLHGLENQTDPGPPVYGDASDPQYGKETLL